MTVWILIDHRTGKTIETHERLKDARLSLAAKIDAFGIVVWSIRRIES